MTPSICGIAASGFCGFLIRIIWACIIRSYGKVMEHTAVGAGIMSELPVAKALQALREEYDMHIELEVPLFTHAAVLP